MTDKALVLNVTGGQECSTCHDTGLVRGSRRAAGAGRLHNDRVRNYSGGRRPNIHDFDIPTIDPCWRCEMGQSES